MVLTQPDEHSLVKEVRRNTLEPLIKDGDLLSEKKKELLEGFTNSYLNIIDNKYNE